MSSGPETRFITSVHRYLPPSTEFHREKMANPYRGGTADSWYSGRKRDLWVEWKWVDLPARPDTIIDITAGKKPSLTMLQRDWIAGRVADGRDVWVIVGSKAGGVLTKQTWLAPVRMNLFAAMCQSKQALAAEILTFCSP